MSDFGTSIKKSFITFGRQLKYAFENPLEIISNYSPTSILIIFMFFITRRLGDIIRVMIYVHKQSLWQSNKLVAEQLFKNILIMDKTQPKNINNNEHIGNFVIEYLLFMIIFIVDFWQNCKEKQSNRIKIENAIQQAMVTVLPLLCIVYFMNIFEWYRRIKTQKWLGDIIEGLLLFFLYNFAMNFREIHQYNVCATTDEKQGEIQKTAQTDKGTGDIVDNEQNVVTDLISDNSNQLDLDYEKSRWLSAQWDTNLNANYQSLNTLYGVGSGGGGGSGAGSGGDGVTGGTYGGTGGLYYTKTIDDANKDKTTDVQTNKDITTDENKQTTPDEDETTVKPVETTPVIKREKSKKSTKSTKKDQITSKNEKNKTTIIILIVVIIVIFIVGGILVYYFMTKEDSIAVYSTPPPQQQPLLTDSMGYAPINNITDPNISGNLPNTTMLSNAPLNTTGYISGLGNRTGVYGGYGATGGGRLDRSSALNRRLIQQRRNIRPRGYTGGGTGGAYGATVIQPRRQLPRRGISRANVTNIW